MIPENLNKDFDIPVSGYAFIEPFCKHVCKAWQVPLSYFA